MYLKATAKINLSLDVLRKREDGYHEVQMVMQKIGMYDRISLEALSGRPGIIFSSNLPYLPCDESNLAVKAAKLLMEQAGVTDGVDIRLDKFIPVAAGLAGGSTDAAAVLTGINRLFRLGISKEDLMKLGKAIGADVPYCILGGTALAEGIGELLSPLPDMPECRILLCKPPINVSTKEVYSGLRAAELTRHPDIEAMIAGLKAGNLEQITDDACMYNVLETVTADRYPVIHEIEQDMMHLGAVNAIMSGSGPTVFGIFTDKEKAETAKLRLKNKRPSSRVFLTWPDCSGKGGRA